MDARIPFIALLLNALTKPYFMLGDLIDQTFQLLGIPILAACAEVFPPSARSEMHM